MIHTGCGGVIVDDWDGDVVNPIYPGALWCTKCQQEIETTADVEGEQEALYNGFGSPL